MSVTVCPIAYLKMHMSKLHEILCRPTYVNVMYFRFCGGTGERSVLSTILPYYCCCCCYYFCF